MRAHGLSVSYNLVIPTEYFCLTGIITYVANEVMRIDVNNYYDNNIYMSNQKVSQ